MGRATALVFLLLAALLCHLHTGDAQQLPCYKTDVKIRVIKTGNVVGGQPEYEVEFATSCRCTFQSVRVWCGGLEKSAVPLDPSKVEVDDGMCVLKQRIARGSPLRFRYSSEVPVDFRVFHAEPVFCKREN